MTAILSAPRPGPRWGRRLLARSLHVALGCGLAGSVGLQAASAQGTGANGTQAKPKWTVRCANNADLTKLSCEVSQSLVDRRSRARILNVTVLPRNGGVAMSIGLPHGTDLRKGVQLTIDRGVTRQLDIVTADAKGAYAQMNVDSQILASLRAGRTMKVAFASRAGQPIALDVDLSGFSAAYDLVPR